MTKSSSERHVYEPDYASPPGGTLQDTIDHLGMSQAELATRTGLSKKTVNRIIQGHEPISHETALKLEMVTGVPAHFWNERELRYRERLARRALHQNLEAAKDWMATIPLRELEKRGLIQRHALPVHRAEAALHFYGVSSPAEWQKLYATTGASFRKSQTLTSNAAAIATWLRIAELTALKMQLPPFNRDAFRAALPRILKLTTERPKAFLRQLVRECSESGLALVFVREIKGCRVSGAAMWVMPDRPMIALSLRHKRNDQFWFAFFHEAGHVLKHGKKQTYVDESYSDDRDQAAEEAEADQFARDLLIPPSFVHELPGLVYDGQIKDLARRIGIAPGIVVGRIQRDRQKFSIHNKLKDVIDFDDLKDIDEYKNPSLDQG